MTVSWNHRYLAVAFREFYICLSDLGAEIESDPWRFTKQSGDEPEDRAAAREKAAAEVRVRLKRFLDNQSISLRAKVGPQGAQKVDRVQYAMASLDDEVFVNLDWEGRSAWSQELLETLLFNTHVAGEKLFEEAEELLRSSDPDWELAYVYLSTISLGFLGKYRGLGGAGDLQSLSRRLLSVVTKGRSTLADDIEPLFPEALNSTLETSDKLGLPPVRRWSLALGVIIIAYMIVQHLAWLQLSTELTRFNEELDDNNASVQEALR